MPDYMQAIFARDQRARLKIASDAEEVRALRADVVRLESESAGLRTRVSELEQQVQLYTAYARAMDEILVAPDFKSGQRARSRRDRVLTKLHAAGLHAP